MIVIHLLTVNNKQMEDLQAVHNVPVGEEWSRTAGLTQSEAAALEKLVAKTPFKTGKKTIPMN